MLLGGYDDDKAARVLEETMQRNLAKSKPITDLQKRVSQLEQKLAELETKLNG
jgi:polyhydroxyalkanoate synthesis regulator phasin